MNQNLQQIKVSSQNLDGVSSKLKYRVAPDSAFAGKTVRIVITATNETASSIPFTDEDVIKISFPSTMVTNLNFSGTTPAKSGYVVQKTTGEDSFSVTVAFDDISIKSQGSLTITFDAVPIVNTTGNTAVTISEKMSGITTPIQAPFTVQATGLGIIAWLDQLVIGQSETTNLNWYSSGGNKVIISGFPTGSGEMEFDVSEQLTSTPVYVPDDHQQWSYTASVYSSSTQKDQVVVLQQNPPMINDYSSVPATMQELRIDEPAVLSWDTTFASSVILTTPVIANNRQMIPALPRKIYPGKDLQQAYKLNYKQLPEKADYILTVNGFKQPAVGSISFKIKPIELVYFKYSDKDQSGVIFQTDPATNRYSNWEILLDPSVNRLTIFQPGGRQDFYYLGPGDKHPQIQYFDSTKKDSGYDLEWITANLNKLVLTPGDISFQGADIASGKYTVNTPGKYTLTGTAADGSTIVSILDVTN